MEKALQIIDRISELSGKVVSVLPGVVVIAIMYEISMRYVFRLPTLWASEVIVYGCGLTYVLGAAWALRERRHVKIDLLYDRLSERGRAILDSGTFVFFALYILVLIWASGKYALKSYALGETSGSAWNPVVYPIKAAIPIGASLLFLQAVAKFIRVLHFAIKGSSL